jgi:hypothetical protein
MQYNRRTVLKTLGLTSTALAVPIGLGAEQVVSPRKRHLIMLSFDDGFRKSFSRIAEIHGSHKLSACLTRGR